MNLNIINLDKNRFNIHRFASKDRSLPVINFVRFKVTAGSDRLYMAATDRYRLAETYLTLEQPAQEDLMVLVEREDLVAVQKRLDPYSTVAFTPEAFIVDGVPVHFRTTDETFPAIDRLWPDLSEAEPVAESFMFNPQYLESFRWLNESPTKDPVHALNLKTQIAVQGSGGWRGLLVKIRSFDRDAESFAASYEL